MFQRPTLDPSWVNESRAVEMLRMSTHQAGSRRIWLMTKGFWPPGGKDAGFFSRKGDVTSQNSPKQLEDS